MPKSNRITADEEALSYRDHDRPGPGHNNPPSESESGDRVRSMRQRDRMAGIVAHSVRIPENYRTGLTILAQMLRDGTPEERRRILVTIANLEQSIHGGEVSKAWLDGLEDPVMKALQERLPDRRCRRSEALIEATAARVRMPSGCDDDQSKG